jgi:orotidine-5'-phosphate decarboxylase
MTGGVGFVEKLTEAISRHDSHLCVGLDPTLEALPEGVERSAESVLAFNRAIIDATADLACAYKPNLAFYEALGAEGWRALRETIRSVPDGIPVIGDAKRGDIGSTATAYAEAIFDYLGCDACTANPYLGFEAIAPFVERPGSFAFVLCRTSNPGASEVQDLLVDGVPLYQRLARLVYEWKRPESCGLVVGATDSAAAGRAAAAAPGLWLLAPGLGAQGGDLEATARALGPSAGMTLWSASRGITAASRGADYAAQARAAAERLRSAINAALLSRPSPP